MSVEEYFDLGDPLEDDDWFHEEERMSRREENFVEFEDVRFGARTEKSVKATFPDGTFRWVPFSQMPEGYEPPAEGETGTLEVSEWLSSKWDEEPAEREGEGDVSIEGCTVMRETRDERGKVKALQVRVPSQGQPIWFPAGQVRETSQCRYDGDSGTLVISRWIAVQKGLVEDEDAEGPPSDVSRDSRRQKRFNWGGTGRHAPGPRKSVGPDPDDDIPF